MKLSEIITLINGKFINQTAKPDHEVKGGCGADLMSDVLACTKPDAILLTGLVNPQTIRTAVMADIRAVIIVRGKLPQPETITLAEQEDIPLITSPLGMFEICGRLFQAGLPSLEMEMSFTE